jgi:hypothetical protein
MEVVHIEQRQSWAHFITSCVHFPFPTDPLCLKSLSTRMAAIVGGVLTVATLADTLLFNTQGLIKKGAAAVAAEGKQPYQPAPVVKLL